MIRYQYGFQSAAPPRTNSSGETTTPLAQVLNEAGEAQTNAVFVQDRFVLGSRFLLNPGVRLTTYDRTQETYMEPRFATYFHANDRFSSRWLLGQYHQFTSKVTREDLLQGNRSFWTAADDLTVPVSSNKELIVGASYQRGQWLADVEAYAKNLSGLSLFAPRFSAATESIDYRNFFYTGTVRPVALTCCSKNSSGRNTGWLSYTLSKVTESFPALAAGAFPADQDQRHELKIVDIHPLTSTRFEGGRCPGPGFSRQDIPIPRPVALKPLLTL